MLWAPLLIESVDGMLGYVAKCGKAQPFSGGGVENPGKSDLKAKRAVSCRESM